MCIKFQFDLGGERKGEEEEEEKDDDDEEDEEEGEKEDEDEDKDEDEEGGGRRRRGGNGNVKKEGKINGEKNDLREGKTLSRENERPMQKSR